MMQVRLKIVPDAKPNADGEWIEASCLPMPEGTSWIAATEHLAPLIPHGFHLVSYALIL